MILEGEPVAREILVAVDEEIRRLPRPPNVVALHNATDPANRSYRKQQARLFPKHGVAFATREFDPKAGEGPLLEAIRELNADPSVTGIAIDQPLPAGFDKARAIAAVDPRKDIEATHPFNLGMLVHADRWPKPVAAAAAVELARQAHPSFRGLDAVVVGRSAMVGKPIALMLLAMGADAPTVTLCHTASKDAPGQGRRADVLFVAAGRAGLVGADWVKPGATVIDVGINWKDGKVAGDVAFDAVGKIAGRITPVPGGVGPVAQALLLRNVAACAR